MSSNKEAEETQILNSNLNKVSGEFNDNNIAPNIDDISNLDTKYNDHPSNRFDEQNLENNVRKSIEQSKSMIK